METDYKALRELLELRYQKKRDALEAEYKRDLKDLERIFSRLQEPDIDDNIGFVRPVASLIEAVKSVLQDIDGDFDINTVIGLIEKRHPEIKTPINPTSVSGNLRKLHKQKVLKIVKPGAGTKPTIYRAIQSAGKQNDKSDNQTGLF